MSYDSPENHRFVEAFRKRWGAGKVTNFVSEPAYFQVHLFRQAVEKLAPSDIHPEQTRKASWGQEYHAPEGLVKISPQNSHTYLWPKIGQAQADGQFKIIEQSREWVEPLPYWAYPGEVCTPTGLVQKRA
jgi:urea transport system substrate-binding protein